MRRDGSPGVLARSPRAKAGLTLALFIGCMSLKILVVRDVIYGISAVGPATLIEIALIAGIMIGVDLFFPDLRFRTLLITDAVLTAGLLALLVYVDYYGLMPSRESLALVGQATTVFDSIGTLLRPIYLLFFVDIIAFTMYGVTHRRQLSEPLSYAAGPSGRTTARTPYPYQHKYVYLMLLPLTLVAILSIRAVERLPQPVDGFAASRSYGLIAYVVASALRSDSTRVARDLGDAKVVQAAIDRIADGREGERFADFERGAFKGKNVVVVQMEALQAAAIGARVDGQEVTPNLNRLVDRSWYFENFVSQVGQGTTSDAEFMVNTSLYPPVAAPAALQYSDRALPSLPRLLRDQGYDALTFHTNSAQYWNRTQLYPALGFTRYYDRSFFGDSDRIALGASDKVLYTKTLEELERYHRKGKPYYAHIISLSSHFPFIGVPNSERTLKLSAPYVGTRVGDYLTEVNYADRQLGAFLDQMDERGLLDDTVLVVYGDHFGIKDPSGEPAERAAVHELLGRPYTAMDLLNVPLVIHTPGQSRGQRVEDTVGQVDLMPTLADPLGVDLAETPHFGRNAFVRTRPLLSGASFVGPDAYLDGVLLYMSDRTHTVDAVSISGRRTTSVPLDAEVAVARVQKLRQLSADYIISLPTRAGFDPDAKRILPDDQ